MLRSSGGTRVLVVEDDPSMALLILAELGRGSCSVSLVENGLMAVRAWLSALDEQPFDAVIMDINMPVMSGQMALHEVRRLERDLDEPRTPIIAFSGGEDMAKMQGWLDMGFDAVLRKPDQLNRLTSLVGQLAAHTRLAS